MKAETWELLNGSGWGQLLSETANPSDNGEAVATSPCRGGLEVPAFMYETTQSVLVPAAAYRAQGVGRVKHAEHQREKQVRHVVNGVFWCLVGFGVFALILNLADKICG